MTKRVREILGYYDSENGSVRNNLSRMLNHGKLAGTGKFVILPVDQGFEHGPARSFAINPAAYDPRYHFQLAIDAGCNAFAAPLGLIEAGFDEFVGEIPIILKVNSHDVLNDEKDPAPSMTASVKDALRLGAAAVGLTIYPGSTQEKSMYEEARAIGEEAKASGLPLVIWSYPRGSGISKQGETALDVVAYAAQIAAQLGANIIKVKPPTAFIEQAEAKKAYDAAKVPVEPLSARIKHVMQAAFAGRRIVIFSGGAKETDENLLNTVRGIHDGGGYGSIIGRNSFQRPKADAIALLGKVVDIYKG
jgi:class I fructose-bisphosphate aldolase